MSGIPLSPGATTVVYLRSDGTIFGSRTNPPPAYNPSDPNQIQVVNNLVGFPVTVGTIIDSVIQYQSNRFVAYNNTSLVVQPVSGYYANAYIDPLSTWVYTQLDVPNATLSLTVAHSLSNHSGLSLFSTSSTSSSSSSSTTTNNYYKGIRISLPSDTSSIPIFTTTPNSTIPVAQSTTVASGFTATIPNSQKPHPNQGSWIVEGNTLVQNPQQLYNFSVQVSAPCTYDVSTGQLQSSSTRTAFWEFASIAYFPSQNKISLLYREQDIGSISISRDSKGYLWIQFGSLHVQDVMFTDPLAGINLQGASTMTINHVASVKDFDEKYNADAYGNLLQGFNYDPVSGKMVNDQLGLKFDGFFKAPGATTTGGQTVYFYDYENPQLTFYTSDGNGGFYVYENLNVNSPLLYYNATTNTELMIDDKVYNRLMAEAQS